MSKSEKAVPRAAYVIYASLVVGLFATYSILYSQATGYFSFIDSLGLAFWPVYLTIVAPYTFAPFLLVAAAEPYFRDSTMSPRIRRLISKPAALMLLAIDLIFVRALGDPATVSWLISFHFAAAVWLFVWWGVVAMARSIRARNQSIRIPALVSELQILSELRNHGGLTLAEFKTAKAKVLDSPSK